MARPLSRTRSAANLRIAHPTQKLAFAAAQLPGASSGVRGSTTLSQQIVRNRNASPAMTGVRSLPAVNRVPRAPRSEVVHYTGGAIGRLYGPNMQPMPVRVISTHKGGPTGLMVQIASSSPTRAARRRNPVAVGGNDTYVAETATCCLIEEAGTFTDPETGVVISTAGIISCPGGEYDGRAVPAVTMQIFDNEDGTRTAVIETGDGTSLTLPVCTSDTPPPPPPSGDPDCCIDVGSMTLVCNDGASPLAGAQVTEIVQVQPSGLHTISFIDPTTGEIRRGRFPACDVPPPPPPPPGGECCFDRATQTLTCGDGDPRDGMSVTVVNSIVATDGTPLVVVAHSSGQLTVPVCEDPPDLCCYDVATGTLRCESNAGLNGQQVSLLAMSEQADGSIVAVVQIQGQRGASTFPICEDRVSECCYDADTMQIRCTADPSLDGTTAAVLSSWRNDAGEVWVWATWPGGGARMPLCPGQVECPPQFCCVNVESMRYVCPGRPDVNGQPVVLADIIADGGFTWGVLADGSRVPLCGRDCPPPELCPDCPSCPPGMWTSPDGTCSPPPTCTDCPPDRIPQCPPGMLLNTRTGQCVKCCDTDEDCPPYPGVVGGAGARPPMARARMLNPTKPVRTGEGQSRLRNVPQWKQDGHCCQECADASTPTRKINCTGCGGTDRLPNPNTKKPAVRRMRPFARSRR